MDKMKENIVSYYNKEADSRNKSIKADWKINIREEFCNLLKKENKKTLLELGAGTGNDSKYFMENGFIVTALDISSEMVKKCQEKSIEAYVLDFYELASMNRSFDCIWAINSLLHVPKSDLSHVLKEIYSVLEGDGLFYMGLYGKKLNDLECEIIAKEISDSPRFYAFHTEKYLKSMLERYFQIIRYEGIEFDIDKSKSTEVEIFHSLTMKKN